MSVPEGARFLTDEEVAARRGKPLSKRKKDFDKYGTEYVSWTPDEEELGEPDNDPASRQLGENTVGFEVPERKKQRWELAKAQNPRDVIARVEQRLLGWARSADGDWLNRAVAVFKENLPNSGLTDREIRALVIQEDAAQMAHAKARDSVERTYRKLGLDRPVEVSSGNPRQPDK